MVSVRPLCSPLSRLRKNISSTDSCSLMIIEFSGVVEIFFRKAESCFQFSLLHTLFLKESCFDFRPQILDPPLKCLPQTRHRSDGPVVREGGRRSAKRPFQVDERHKLVEWATLLLLEWGGGRQDGAGGGLRGGGAPHFEDRGELLQNFNRVLRYDE